MIKAIKHIILHCGNLKPNETAVVLCDNKTLSLAKLFINEIKKKTNKVNIINVGNLNFHGQEINKEIKDKMCHSKIIFCLTSYSLAHSSARIEASKAGARFLSLPDYSKKFISNPSIVVDYKKISVNMKKFTKILNNGKKIIIENQNGDRLNLKISKRKANFCPGFVKKKGDLGSPPDIETNISPLENFSFGTVLINGSVTHPKIKLLKEPIKLTIKKGKIKKIESKNKKNVQILNKLFGNMSSKKRVLAECGIGFNPKARLSGHMLTDEGSRGCIHLGFGSNYTVGGKNKVNFHIDLIMKKTSMYVDEKMIIKKGIFLI